MASVWLFTKGEELYLSLSLSVDGIIIQHQHLLKYTSLRKILHTLFKADDLSGSGLFRQKLHAHLRCLAPRAISIFLWETEKVLHVPISHVQFINNTTNNTQRVVLCNCDRLRPSLWQRVTDREASCTFKRGGGWSLYRSACLSEPNIPILPSLKLPQGHTAENVFKYLSAKCYRHDCIWSKMMRGVLQAEYLSHLTHVIHWQ